MTDAAAVPGPLRLKEMTPNAARAAFAAVPKLIVPVGTCEAHGAHLPLGCDTIVVEHLADDLSAAMRIVRAPTIEFGVNDESAGHRSGDAAVRRKTLRRFLNDMLTDWEQAGVREFLILTMHGHAPHQEALATVLSDRARVLVIDVLALDFGVLVDDPTGPIHGGEIDTSLLLHVAPHLVQLDQSRDFILAENDAKRYRRGSTMVIPAITDGSIGAPSRASARKGRRLYDLILERLVSGIGAANSLSRQGYERS